MSIGRFQNLEELLSQDNLIAEGHQLRADDLTEIEAVYCDEFDLASGTLPWRLVGRFGAKFSALEMLLVPR